MTENSKLCVIYSFCYKMCYYALLLLGFFFSIAANYITSHFGEYLFPPVLVLYPIAVVLLVLTGLLRLSHVGRVEPCVVNKNKISAQRPICIFCYKWCPRLLVVTGILVVIIYSLLFLGIDLCGLGPIGRTIESLHSVGRILCDFLDYIFPTVRLLATITVAFTAFTILLKILRSPI